MSRGKNDLQYTRSDAMLHGGVLLMKPGFTGNFLSRFLGREWQLNCCIMFTKCNGKSSLF